MNGELVEHEHGMLVIVLGFRDDVGQLGDCKSDAFERRIARAAARQDAARQL